MLGYTEVSWNNFSGKEQLPWSAIKFWSSLTVNEKAAVVVLGYTQASWDNNSGSVPQPASATKTWAMLTACADGPDSFYFAVIFQPLYLRDIVVLMGVSTTFLFV